MTRESSVRAFIATLRGRLGDAAPPVCPELREDVVRQVRSDDDLIARFERAATRAGCTVTRLPAAELPEQVASALVESGAKAAWVAPGLTEAITRAVGGVARVVRRQTEGDVLFGLDAAITGVEMAIAETGSLVCISGPHTVRGASLVPPLHVAIVRAEQIAADLCDALAELSRRAELPAHVTLITGPSKTADVEGVLVTGVHGPRAVRVLLVSATG